jgi:FKBP-type peptidyl-prolyl cis-trans isomerase SlyD
LFFLREELGGKQKDDKMIENGKKVKINYTLTVDDQVVDSSTGKEPLEYEHGGQTIIPGLQNELTGLNAGDKKQVTVQPQDGYGELNPQAVMEVPKADLGDAEVKEGTPIRAQSKTGQAFQGLVKEVRSDIVIVDFNHPLAGKVLVFDVEVMGIE